MSSDSLAPSAPLSDRPPKPGIARVVYRFVWEIDGLATSLPLIMKLMAAAAKKERGNFEAFLAQRAAPGG
ncbi:MAG TPA: hypothetical protein VKR26_20245, partial [Terriglobales bacterium]|nr:hypothetical protein [Terriglobales bacterium]